jgi:hypothetical protein
VRLDNAEGDLAMDSAGNLYRPTLRRRNPVVLEMTP